MINETMFLFYIEKKTNNKSAQRYLLSLNLFEVILFYICPNNISTFYLYNIREIIYNVNTTDNYYYRRQTEIRRECDHNRVYCQKRIVLCFKLSKSVECWKWQMLEDICRIHIKKKKKIHYRTAYIVYALIIPKYVKQQLHFYFVFLLHNIIYNNNRIYSLQQLTYTIKLYSNITKLMVKIFVD